MSGLLEVAEESSCRDGRLGSCDACLVAVNLAVELVRHLVFSDGILEVFAKIHADYGLAAEESG